MRARLTAACALLAVIVALCGYAAHTIKADTEQMRSLSMRARSAVEGDDYPLAESLIKELAQLIDERRPELEVLAPHEYINEISAQATEARVRLKYEQEEEFICAMEQILDSLTLLNERQTLTWGNLF